MNELFQQVRILDPLSQSDRLADILICDSKIEAIAPQLTQYPSDSQITPPSGYILAPGLVDLYSQSSDPGHEDRETLDQLAQAALAGGFTHITLLPNTTPPLDTAATCQFLQQKAQTLPKKPQFHYWGAITRHLAGEQLAELDDLRQNGVIGWSDGKTLAHWGLLRRALEYAQPWQKPLALGLTHPQLQEQGVMREGPLSIQMGLVGDPAYSESATLAALLEIIAAFSTPVHLMRVSTARSVELIAQAKGKGLSITASTPWHHLLLDTSALMDYDPNLRLDPPLGNSTDRLALQEGVKTGVIDAIAIDHTPYSYEEKTVAFAEAPPGALGLQLALPLLWQHLIRQGDWTPLQLWNALSTAPHRCLQQPPLECTPGTQGGFILFDPQAPWTVDSTTLHSACQNTYWWGKTLQGKVLRVW
ncbi:dihydroorotase [Spirulina subsalsa FACHB-351]|uniref:Dihydroorotase n=1 Tax=Spirulina subsalsa FACHB-351 TaxID=234711 RepID=A0ABT3L185_9CYAN|nr:dihydroorotase [Spirulina subsalsa]MCW6034884.1 dihydroorotase [Spirulina subsalsa FACHB-351]